MNRYWIITGFAFFYYSCFVVANPLRFVAEMDWSRQGIPKPKFVLLVVIPHPRKPDVRTNGLPQPGPEKQKPSVMRKWMFGTITAVKMILYMP